MTSSTCPAVTPRIPVAGRVRLERVVGPRGRPDQVILREMLGRLLGLVGEFEILHDGLGRPEIPGRRESISFSRCRDRLLVGVAGEGFEIGVDVERLPGRLGESFSRQALLPSEEILAATLRSEGWTRREATVLFWSLKEAAAKCRSVAFVPSRIRVVRREGPGRAVVRVGEQELDVRFARGPDWLETWAVSSKVTV